MATNRHTFAFVVEGIALSDAQKAAISKAVAEAGATALGDSVGPKVEYIIGPNFPGYRGKPAYDLALVQNLNVGELVGRTVSEVGLLEQ